MLYSAPPPDACSTYVSVLHVGGLRPLQNGLKHSGTNRWGGYKQIKVKLMERANVCIYYGAICHLVRLPGPLGATPSRTSNIVPRAGGSGRCLTGPRLRGTLL